MGACFSRFRGSKRGSSVRRFLTPTLSPSAGQRENITLDVTSARQLGLSSAVALVVASMIGTGVFTTSGFLLADLKSPWLVMAAWVLGGVLATLGAVSYGALARRIPESGGEYTFLSQTLHPAEIGRAHV